MSGLTTDRVAGLRSSLALKAPVVATTTAAITLSGEQTIDGVSVVAGNRVLVKDQATGSENGIYDVSATAWTRSKDFNGLGDIVRGTRVFITQGTTYAGYEAQVTTADPITIGTTSLTFNMILVLDADNAAAVATVATNIVAVQNASANATAAAASADAAAAAETAAGVSETNAAASAATALAATIGKYGAHIDIAFADSPYTVGTLTEDTLITVNTSGGNVVINLPQSTGEDDNRLIGINKNGATNTITINPYAGDTVGGAASFVQYDDTEWADFYLDKSALNWQLGNLSFTAAGSGLTKTGSTISTDFASISEVSTGTSAVKSVNPDALAGSIFGTAVVPLIPFNSATACAVGNGAGSLLFRVPSVLNGMNLVAVAAAVGTAGTTGTMDIQIANVTQAADMLTTKITIDSGETDSSTAATPAVIDTANDDVATGDQLRIDVDAVHTTPATGLMVELQFRLP